MTRNVAATAVILLAGCALATFAHAATPAAKVPFVRLYTEEGNILLALFPDLAPNHVANFRHLAATGFYGQTAFHRTVPEFVIQGGDPNTKNKDPQDDGQGGPGIYDVLTKDDVAVFDRVNAALEARGYKRLDFNAPVGLKQEFSKTAKHLRGTLSMARNQGLDTGGSQFFICVAATPSLDEKYTIFGHVVTGLDVADAIVEGPTQPGKAELAARPIVIMRTETFEGLDKLKPAERAAYDQMLAGLKAGGSTW